MKIYTSLTHLTYDEWLSLARSYIHFCWSVTRQPIHFIGHDEDAILSILS